MEVTKGTHGEDVVTQKTYRIYIDPSSNRIETDWAHSTGRSVSHVGQTLTLTEGKFGGAAKQFVTVAVHMGREYDCVIYERKAG